MSRALHMAGSSATGEGAFVSRMNGRAAVVRHQYFSDADGRREAGALASVGLETTLLCLRRPGEARFERIDGVDVRRFRSPKQRGGFIQYVVDYSCWFALCFTWLSIEQLRRPFRVVQITTLPDFQVFAAALTRLRGTTVVLFVKEPAAELVESTGGSPLVARAMRMVTRVAINRADLAFAVTDQHRQLYIDLGADLERVAVIENTPPREFLGVDRGDRRPSRTCTVLCHGMIEERYGHATIVEAAKELRARGHNAHIVITGSGTWAPTLDRLISEHELGDVVDHRGYVSASELDGLLATATIGLVAQLASPYSNVVHTQKMFEFFSLGIPVIASRLDSTEAYFPDAVEFFESGDGSSLAEAIMRLDQDEPRRSRLIANADLAYAELEWPRLREKYLHAIARAVNDT